MSALAQLLITQLEFNHRTLHINLEGFGHEDSLRQFESGGNCLNWILGHLVSTRGRTLELVGKEPIWSDEIAAPYRRKSEGITENATGVLDFGRIMGDFDASQEIILEGLQNIDSAELELEAAGSAVEKPTAKQLAGIRTGVSTGYPSLGTPNTVP